jgi:uncharacterized protein (DUF433 family)
MAKTESGSDAGLVVSRNKDIHSGALVFSGTRVPVSILVDYLKAGDSIDDFLAGYPSVERWQVEAFLELSPEAVEHLSQHGASSSR